MSKTKKSNSGTYEILYIVSNEFSEDEVRGIDNKVQKIIEDNNSKIIEKESLGKKRLAYKIKKFDYGYYNLIIFDTGRENVTKIDRLVRQMREILRYCIVVNEDEKIEKRKKEDELKKKTKKEDRENKRKESTPKPSLAEPKPSTAKAKVIKEDKVNLETPILASNEDKAQETDLDKKKEIKKSSIKTTDKKKTSVKVKDTDAKNKPSSDKATDIQEGKDGLDKKLDDILEAKNLF